MGIIILALTYLVNYVAKWSNYWAKLPNLSIMCAQNLSKDLSKFMWEGR